MTLIVDAGPLIAVFGAADPRWQEIADLLAAEPGVLVMPPPVTAEADYVIGRYFGASVRREFLGDLAAGRFVVPELTQEDYAEILRLDTRYGDLGLGLADCSVAILAARYETTRILTFDERHFRAIGSPGGTPFTILPADA